MPLRADQLEHEHAREEQHVLLAGGVLALLVFTLVTMSLAILRFRKRLD